MKWIYQGRWIIAGTSAFMWLFTFIILFAGGTATFNRAILAINMLLILLQISNMITAFKKKNKPLFTLLFVIFAFTLGGMLINYIWSWNYTIKALTIGFE